MARARVVGGPDRGTVLAGVSAAQRTSSAFSSFSKREGYGAAVFSSSPFPKNYFKLPCVSKVTNDDYWVSNWALRFPKMTATCLAIHVWEVRLR